MTVFIGYYLGLVTWVGLSFYLAHLGMREKWKPVFLAGMLIWLSIALMTLGAKS